MITITILTVDDVLDDNNAIVGRVARVHITDGTDTYALPVGGVPPTGDVQTYLDRRAKEIWRVAQKRGTAVNIVHDVSERDALSALIHVLADELTRLRAKHGMNAITAGDIKRAMQDELEGRAT